MPLVTPVVAINSCVLRAPSEYLGIYDALAMCVLGTSAGILVARQQLSRQRRSFLKQRALQEVRDFWRGIAMTRM